MSGNDPAESQTAEPGIEQKAFELAAFIEAELGRRRQQAQHELELERASLAELEREIRRAGDGLNPISQSVQRMEAIQRARREKEAQLEDRNQAIKRATKKREDLNELLAGWYPEWLLECARIIVGELLPSLAENVASGRRSVNDRYEAVTHSPLAADSGVWKQVREMMSFLGFDVEDVLGQECKSLHTLYVRVDARRQPDGEAA